MFRDVCARNSEAEGDTQEHVDFASPQSTYQWRLGSAGCNGSESPTPIPKPSRARASACPLPEGGLIEMRQVFENCDFRPEAAEEERGSVAVVCLGQKKSFELSISLSLVRRASRGRVFAATV
jgi:hypothetical protein